MVPEGIKNIFQSTLGKPVSFYEADWNAEAVVYVSFYFDISKLTDEEKELVMTYYIEYRIYDCLAAEYPNDYSRDKFRKQEMLDNLLSMKKEVLEKNKTNLMDGKTGVFKAASTSVFPEGFWDGRT